MMISASATAAWRLALPVWTTCAKSSTVYRYTSFSALTSGSISRGTAKSTINIGRWRRCFKACCTAPNPMIGSVLAVQLMTASNSCSRAGTSAKRMVSAPKRFASASPRSSVRLAITMLLGWRAAKWVATSSIISPAPTNKMRMSDRFSNNCAARRTEAAAMLMLCAPIWVELRTSFATANER